MFWSFALQSILQVECSGWRQSRPDQIKQDQPKCYIRAQTCEKYSKVLWSIQTSLYTEHITALWHSKELCCTNGFPVLAVGLRSHTKDWCYKWQYVPVFLGGRKLLSDGWMSGVWAQGGSVTEGAVQPASNSAGWRSLRLGKRGDVGLQSFYYTQPFAIQVRRMQPSTNLTITVRVVICNVVLSKQKSPWHDALWAWVHCHPARQLRKPNLKENRKDQA